MQRVTRESNPLCMGYHHAPVRHDLADGGVRTSLSAYSANPGPSALYYMCLTGTPTLHGIYTYRGPP